MPYNNFIHRTAHLLEAGVDAVSSRLRHHIGFDDPIRIEPYHGFGNERILCMGGRVLADPTIAEPDPDGDGDSERGPLDNVTAMLRRYATDEVPDARVRVTVGSVTEEVVSDSEGYLDFTMDTPRGLDPGALWHDVRYELVEPITDDTDKTLFEGRVQIPRRAHFAVISDVDDTVVHTGANNLLRHARTVLFNNARTRLPLEGIGEFYRALQCNTVHEPINPIFYVSSSPWNLYGLFVRFMRMHDVPLGSIKLKDFGIDEHKFVRGGHGDHKIEAIEQIAGVYPDLELVLLGDSGQQDPEIYARLARKHADRIKAIYIRDVSSDGRDKEVDRLAEELGDLGVPMIRAETTERFEAHARKLGLIA